jgi:hypothetical protein
MKHSISKEVLGRFARGQATPEERRAVGRHLLHGCPVCARALRSVLLPGTGNEPRKRLRRMKRRVDETESHPAPLPG